MIRCDKFDEACRNKNGATCPLFATTGCLETRECLIPADAHYDECVVAVPNGPYDFREGKAVPLDPAEQTEQVDVVEAAAKMVLAWFDSASLNLSDPAMLGYIIGRCEQILASKEGRGRR